ncbi:type VI secretion system baseplate subunit TssK [Citrobacter amalonaticus]|uniref:type VI secretion system baseplate subunit TssK n=1 Tax=Citrobacter amalonaticus TaxID=35703 RepID=UPI001902F703|nr:type VI secretion system baseplate subunit TssK [Citrobacter amalonaticus]MBJ9256827.1 type VI secretion system baseplate subunit TssK [Citrobacter amalonaticus]
MTIIPELVCWYEGMAMLPQHFQLQSLRHDALAAALAGYANPWFWGVNHLDIDDAALCAGTLRLLRLKAIMPDGLPIDYDIHRDPPLEFDCARLLPAAADSEHTLWLALPSAYRGGQWQPFTTRFRSVASAPLPDLTSGEFPESIASWQPAPRLVSRHERADLLCLPLIQVVYTEGGFRRSDWFPPSPQVDESSTLCQQTREICLLAREKILFLSREAHLARQNDRTHDWLCLTLCLQSLQGALPLLECLVNSGRPHPADLFRTLCLFCGQTAILNQDKPLPWLPGFDYENMQPGFSALFTLLRTQLSHIQRRRLRLNFTAGEDDFSLMLPAGIRPGEQVVIGVLMPEGSPLSAVDWLQASLIACQPFLPLLRRQRMHGMSVAPLAAQQRTEWETDSTIALFSLTLTTQWFEPDAPLVIAPLHETSVKPERIMLYRLEAQHHVNGD